MKKLSIVLIFISITTSVLGQLDNDTVFLKYNKDIYKEKPNYNIDTIIFDTPMARQILYGTTVLPCTRNQQIAKGYGLFLNSVSITPCYENDKLLNSEIIAIAANKGNLTIEVKYWGNCCHSFLCDLEVKNDTVLNLIIHGYGTTYCSCDCSFGLTYHISTMKFFELDKLKYIMINGEEETKNKIKTKFIGTT